MKKKSLAIIMSIALVGSLMSGCGSKSTTKDYAGQTIYGEVTAVSTDSITIDVGTMNMDADASADETSTEDFDPTSTDMTSGLELTGESLTVTVTDSTSITQMSMGGGNMGGGMNGGGDFSADSEDGTTMEMPEGDGTTDGEAPSGDMEMPSGDMGDGEMPSGDGQGGTMEIPNSGSEDGSTMEMPSGRGGDSTDGEMPSDLPDSDGTTDGEAPSDLPDSDGTTDGDFSGGMGGGMSASTEEISISDITVGDTVSITFDDDGNATEITVMSMGTMGGGNGTGGGTTEGGSNDVIQGNGGVDSYTAVTEYATDTTVDGETFTSTGTDENAILVSSDTSVSLSNITVERTSSDSTGGDNSSFYGVGAAILATAGTTTISNATITTDAAGGAGVFAYGDATVYVSDTTITTSKDTSGGIHAAGGGTLYATNLTVTTSGESSAAIRSDRGGGTMVVDGGTYTSNGTGSPAVYSTADITVSNATLEATSSEAVCIEGLNSLTLTECDLTGNMQDSSQNDCTWNVILYQSMSGDSEVGNSTFSMTGGTLTAKNGGMFYTTNTESTFILSGVDITYASDSEFFLRCTGNANERGWGSTGSNGAQCSFTAISQEMEGAIIWDSISTLDFSMEDGSTLTGYFVNDETYAGDGGDGYASVTIDSTSTWVVTADSTVTTLNNSGTIKDVDGNSVTIVGADGTVYEEGTSPYTITVTSYGESSSNSTI